MNSAGGNKGYHTYIIVEYIKVCVLAAMISIGKKIKMYNLSNFVFFVSYLCLSQGLVIENECPQNVEPVDNFNLSAVSGLSIYIFLYYDMQTSRWSS